MKKLQQTLCLFTQLQLTILFLHNNPHNTSIEVLKPRESIEKSNVTSYQFLTKTVALM